MPESHHYLIEHRSKNDLGETTWESQPYASWAVGIVLKRVSLLMLKAEAELPHIGVADRERYIEIDLGTIDLDA